MLDGTYELTVKIPFKRLSGVATIVTHGDGATVTVEGEGLSHTCEGTCEGDSFSFADEVDSPFGRMSFSLAGTVVGDHLDAECVTMLGTFKASGTRVA